MEKEKKKIKKTNSCQREMEVTISEDKIKKKYKESLDYFAGRAKIKGFRKGKAPINLVKQMYQDDIKSSVINDLAPKAIHETLSKENIFPVGSPVITDIDFQDGKPLKLNVKYEVWPEFNLPKYKDLKVKKEKNSVSKKDVDESLQNLREKSAKYNPIENRETRKDDYVLTEIKGRDLDSKKMLPTEKTVVLVGHADNEKSLNEALTGMQTGEEKDFTIHYGKEHKNKRLVGKHIKYTVKVLSIKEKSLPELNDDFAKDFGEFKDLNSLKNEIEKELTTSKENISKQKLTDEIIKKISDKVDFDLPESVVAQETVSNIQKVLSSLQRKKQNLNKEELDKIKEEARERARKSIKNHLILNKIAEKENLEISDKELEEEYKSLAKANNVPLTRIREYMKQDDRKENLKQNMLLRKTVDFLVDNARIEG
jgi:trigger factor